MKIESHPTSNHPTTCKYCTEMCLSLMGILFLTGQFTVVGMNRGQEGRAGGGGDWLASVCQEHFGGDGMGNVCKGIGTVTGNAQSTWVVLSSLPSPISHVRRVHCDGQWSPLWNLEHECIPGSEPLNKCTHRDSK